MTTRHGIIASNKEALRPMFRIWNDLSIVLRQLNKSRNGEGGGEKDLNLLYYCLLNFFSHLRLKRSKICIFDILKNILQ